MLFWLDFAEDWTGLVFVATCTAGTAYAFSLLVGTDGAPSGLSAIARSVVLFLCIAVVVVADGRAQDGANVPRFTLLVFGAMALAVVGLARLAQGGMRPRWPRGLEWPLL